MPVSRIFERDDTKSAGKKPVSTYYGYVYSLFITGMKNIYKIMGIHKEVPVSLSTSQVFAVVFFFMIYTGKKNQK